MKGAYHDTFKTGRAATPPMDPVMEGFIKGSHFSVGDGIFGGNTEQNAKYSKPGAGGRVNMSPDRLAFMKGAHFDHGNPGLAFQGSTQHNSVFKPKDVSKGGANYEGSTAYELRNRRQTVGEVGRGPQEYVTHDHMRYKWVQPKNKDAIGAAGK